MIRTPTPAQAIRIAVERVKSNIRVAMPAKIVSFNPSTQLAEVQPLLNDFRENDDFEIEVRVLPNVVSVPVVFAGSGSYFVTHPVSPGDTCQLLINDRALDYFISNGAAGLFPDERVHDLSDAVAIVGLRSQANALAEFDTSRLCIGKQGALRVAVGSDVQLGVAHNEQATEQAVLGTGFVQVSVQQLNATAAALQTASAAMGTLAGAAGAALPLAPLVPGFTTALSAFANAAAQLQTLASQLPSKLSTKVKLK